MPLRLLLLILCLMTGGWVRAGTVDLGDQHVLSIGASADVLEDTSAALSFEQVTTEPLLGRFRPASGPIENHGFTSSAFWYRFALNNRGNQSQWILEIPDGLVFWVDTYLVYPDGKRIHKAGGSTVPTAEKDLRSRIQVFRLEIPPTESVVLYVRVASELPVLVPFNLHRGDTYNEAAVRDVTGHLLYFGMMLAILIYSVSVGFSLRERTYLYYIPFLLSATLIFLHLYGFLLQLVSLETYWIGRLMWLCVIATMIFCNRFSLQFLEVPRLSPRLVRWFDGILAIKLLLTLVLFILPVDVGPMLLVVAVLGTTFLCLLAAIVSTRRGFWPAKLYLLSWAFLTVGILCFVMMSIGLLPRNEFTYNSMQIGSAAEALLLTYSLGVRVRVINAERESVLSQLSRQDKMAALGLLSAGVAHDINNPTQFVRTSIENAAVDLRHFSEFLASLMEVPDLEIEAEFKRRTDRISDHLALALDGTGRIADIVRSMRAVSRTDEDQSGLFDPNETLLSTIKLVNATWKQLVRIDVSLEASGQVNGRPSELGQVFMNLLVNSCHAIEERRKTNDIDGRIDVSSCLREGQLYISLQDNGCGMSEETLHRLFEPFFTTKGSDRGTGLGMGIIKRILDNHQGRLEVQSTPGSGTTMTVILPLATG